MPIISGVKTDAITIGKSTTDSQNFQLSANNDGTAKLARGSDGSLGDILTVASDGKVTLTSGVTTLATEGVTSSSGVIGYGVGAGGSVTQITNKATSVTLNNPTGQITSSNASLAAGTSVTFTFNNSVIKAGDGIVLTVQSGTTGSGQYLIGTDFVTTGRVDIFIRNLTGGALAQAVAINFAIIKGVSA